MSSEVVGRAKRTPVDPGPLTSDDVNLLVRLVDNAHREALAAVLDTVENGYHGTQRYHDQTRRVTRLEQVREKLIRVNVAARATR